MPKHWLQNCPVDYFFKIYGYILVAEDFHQRPVAPISSFYSCPVKIQFTTSYLTIYSI